MEILSILTESLPALTFTIVVAAQFAVVPIVRSANDADQPPIRPQRCRDLNDFDQSHKPSETRRRDGTQAPPNGPPPALPLSPGPPAAAMRRFLAFLSGWRAASAARRMAQVKHIRRQGLSFIE